MAKINHNNFLDTVDSIWTTAKEKGIMHLNSEEEFFDGKTFTIGGKVYKNFGTCGYLGLEKHPLLIEGAVDMLRKYGTQLSMSRAYVRPPYIQELEELISQIFDGNKAIVYTSTSTAHLSILGTIIKPDDLIILDQQVHYSVQYPCKFAKLQGTEVKMVRHSNYELLEDMIKEEYNKYNRIWYMADGVYSMHGDLPDTLKLKALMDKYPKLHLYFDDAHGMSWGGKNGAGNVFDYLGASNRIVLISTLAKGFGCVGGTAIFADYEMYRKIDTYGGILTYTHPLTPANTGAAIASAKIHLSSEIYEFQAELKGLMDRMNHLLFEKNLTNTSSPNSPIYFIGGGSSKVTHNLVHRILGEGLYINTATFPVVPNEKSGLRFTLTRHNTLSDVEELADALAFHLPKAIEEENDQIERVYSVFNVPYLSAISEIKEEKINTDLIVEEYTTINEIDKQTWDNALKDRGNISHSGMQCMEEIFSNNEKPEENWSFHYILVKDKTGKLILATFFTGAIYKDDMLSLENVSKKIEEVRKNDPYFLCSKTLAMGSLFAEGNFIFLDEENKNWREAVDQLFIFVDKVKKEIKATVVVFRDFEEDNVLNAIIEEEGYAKLNMPNSHRIEHPKWHTVEELLSLIPAKKKRDNIKEFAIRHIEKFDISIKKNITKEESEKYYQLFCNVKEKNFAYNFFHFPNKTVLSLNKYHEWEFIEIRVKGKNNPIACVWCFVGDQHYCPLIMGLDYNYLNTHHIYKQAVFQAIKRGNDLNKEKTFLGFSADFEKQKYLAKSICTFAFIKVDDTYNLELIESYSNN